MDLNVFSSAWSQIYPLIVNLVLTLVLLFIGYVVAKWLGSLTAAALKLLQVDKGAKQIGLTALLEKGEIKRSAAELLGDVVYWAILLVTVIGIAKIFALPIEPALGNIFSYLGLVFLAAIVLGIGLIFATLFSSVVRVIAVNFGIEGGKTLSRVIYYFVVVMAFLAALAQLGVSPEVFTPQIGVIIGAFGLAAAIAFGLGCKDMAADFLHHLFKSK